MASKAVALISAVAVGAAAWFVSPYLSEDFAQAWFIGTGDWNRVAIAGRDIAAGVSGLLVWIGALHRR